MSNTEMAHDQAFAQQVVDLNASEVQRKGTVELRPLRHQKHKEPQLMFRCYQDPGGLWYGIPIGKRKDGTFKFKLISIKGYRIYNLSLKQDADEWHIVKNHPTVKGSKFQGAAPMFYAHNEEKAAEEYIAKTVNSRRFEDFVLDLSGNKLNDFARLFGVNPATNAPSIIKKIMIERAKENPTNFEQKIRNDSSTLASIVFKRAEAVGIIGYRLDEGYMYNNTYSLGPTEESVITKLMDDEKLRGVIDLESKQADAHYVTDVKNAPLEETKIPEPRTELKIDGKAPGSESNKSIPNAEAFIEADDNWSE